MSESRIVSGTERCVYLSGSLTGVRGSDLEQLFPTAACVVQLAGGSFAVTFATAAEAQTGDLFFPQSLVTM